MRKSEKRILRASEYCRYGVGETLFGYSYPPEDYFNDNLDQFYDEDDFFDYTNSLANDIDLEDKTYTHSHKSMH
jgi:hypothetical protein